MKIHNIAITKGIMRPRPGRKVTKEDLEWIENLEKEIKNAKRLVKKWKK